MEIAKTIAPFCLIIIMFGLGLGLTVADFTRLIKIPRDFIVGFFGQVILLPIVAFILIQIISLPPEISPRNNDYCSCPRRRDVKYIN